MSQLTDCHVFCGVEMALAEKKPASMEADGAEDFARQLYEDEDHLPLGLGQWL
ncbi:MULTISPECIES: hypothetical protein [unclassified Pseudomonas]|jgi:hypothetical protein|uniref:hypothetical protein n=1 Tax=unclassified Pseudomonas TaxID=196821 RepID=UPI0003771570|nr:MULTISPECIES: hypothetical protein [unclassified Pseudomonas]MBT1268951.1 hypothetical protein [Pseudomonas sp. VS38]